MAVIACACLAGCAAGERASGGDAERAAEAVAIREAAPPAGAMRSELESQAHGTAAKREVGATRASVARIVVTRDDPALPAGCRPRPLARRIAVFFDAFNRGDPSAADYIAPSGGWYSVSDGGRRHFVTYSRRGLPGYFARRHRRGERLRLEQVDVSFGNGLGHMAYLVDRRADDLRRLGITGTTAIGKGAVNCETGQIVVWSMGMPPGSGHERFEVCPLPRTPSRAIVACARRGG
jgi:hypothetical protein